MFISENFWVEVVVYLTAGATVATPFLLANIRVAPALGLVDWPKARGVSEEQIPLVGMAITILSVITMGVLHHYYGVVSSWFLISALIMGVIGYFDDRQPLSAIEKLFWQLLCTGTVFFLDPLVYNTITEQYGTAGTAFGMFFMLGLVNAINFIDGIDGLAGTMVIMGGIGLAAYARLQPDYYAFFMLAALIVGMLVPFMYLNLKRKAFLGNTGSYFLGYTLAYLHLATPLNAETIYSKLALSSLCFVVPIADAIVVVCSRIFTVRSPFMADKGHLHHRMVQTSIALSYVLMNFGFIAVGGLIVGVALNETPAIRFSPTPVIVAIGHLAITAILILLMEKASKRRVRSYIERLDHQEPLYFLKYQVVGPKGLPVTRHALKRLEAKVSAEIRVTDVCFTREPSELLVVLKSFHDPLKFMAQRLSPIFRDEGLESTLVVETGEFVKISSKADPITVRQTLENPDALVDLPMRKAN